MLRESQKPDSVFLFIGASSQKIFVYRRDGKGAFASQDVNIPNNPAIGMIYFKFDQENGKSTAAYSYDSAQWEAFPKLTIPVDGNTLVGFAQSSGSITETIKARMEDVSPTKQP